MAQYVVDLGRAPCICTIDLEKYPHTRGIGIRHDVEQHKTSSICLNFRIGQGRQGRKAAERSANDDGRGKGLDHRCGVGAKAGQRRVTAPAALAMSALIVGHGPKPALSERLHDVAPYRPPFPTGMKQEHGRPASKIVEAKRGIRSWQRTLNHETFLTLTSQTSDEP